MDNDIKKFIEFDMKLIVLMRRILGFHYSIDRLNGEYRYSKDEIECELERFKKQLQNILDEIEEILKKEVKNR